MPSMDSARGSASVAAPHCMPDTVNACSCRQRKLERSTSALHFFHEVSRQCLCNQPAERSPCSNPPNPTVLLGQSCHRGCHERLGCWWCTAPRQIFCARHRSWRSAQSSKQTRSSSLVHTAGTRGTPQGCSEALDEFLLVQIENLVKDKIQHGPDWCLRRSPLANSAKVASVRGAKRCSSQFVPGPRHLSSENPVLSCLPSPLALPFADLSNATDRAMSIKLTHSPAANWSAREHSSSRPTDPEPGGRCDKSLGINPKSFLPLPPGHLPNDVSRAKPNQNSAAIDP